MTTQVPRSSSVVYRRRKSTSWFRRALAAALLWAGTHASARAQDLAGDAGSSAPSSEGADVDAVGFSDTAVAAESGSDADAAGFSTTEATSSQAPHGDDSAASSESFGVAGFVRSLGALWVERTESNPLASLRQTLHLEVSGRKEFGLGSEPTSLSLRAAGDVAYDLAYLHDRSGYDAPTLEAYEADLIARELQAALAVGAFELTVGRQIVNWGQGEVLQVLDVINPRDLREPGLTPAGEMRLSTSMVRAGLTLSPCRLEAVIASETFFGYFPPPLATFSPLRRLLFDTPGFEQALSGKDLRYRHEPGHALIDPSGSQVHARLSYNGGAFDLALHASSVLDPLGVPKLPAAAAFAAQDIDIPLHHPRYSLLGLSAAVPAGSLLFRGELAAGVDRPLAVRDIGSPLLVITQERHTQLDGLLGATWFIAGSTTAALELTQSYLFDNPARRAPGTLEPLWPIEATRIALRFDYRFFRERASLGVLGLVIGVHELNAWLARLELGYALLDSLHLLAGVITYHPTKRFGPFYGFSDHDRAYLALQWDFSIE